jgi:hypothetical protein
MKNIVRTLLATVLLSLFLPISRVLPMSAYSPAPDLPQATVDVTMPPITTVTYVPPGALQAALDEARPGDSLVLTAGATYEGPFTLPAKAGSGWIMIATSGAMPPPGGRVAPGHAPQMARILGGIGSAPAINTAPGAHHYRFIGIEFAPSSGQHSNTGLVLIGTGSETNVAQLPHHIILDRSYIHGDPVAGGKRGIAANGAHIAVVDSYVSDWHVGGDDTQAFESWGGSGPFLLQNSYFEASGENVMFGGADTRIENLVPSDITIVGNEFVKPLAWRGAANATVKNLLELKNARRVLIDHNTFANNWADGQTGTAIVFKSANQDGANPWAVTEHVTFTNNLIGHVGGGMAINTEPYQPAQTASHFLIRNNVFEDVNSAVWGGRGQFVILIGPLDDVVFDGNWADTDGSIIVADGSVITGFVFINNVARHNAYGVIGTGCGVGTSTLMRYFPRSIFTGNQLIGGAAFASEYPAGNTFSAVMPPVTTTPVVVPPTPGR